MSFQTEASKLRELYLLFQGLPEVRERTLPLAELLERQAEALREAYRAGSLAVAPVLRAMRTAEQQGQAIEVRDAALLAGELTQEAARQALARWYGFSGWAKVLRVRERKVEPSFEAACDAIVAGDVTTLRRLLAEQPALVSARSPFHHRSTLLHYVAANGIENHRQWQSPANAREVAEILIAAGADPSATCQCYGESDTLLGLLVTSQHPSDAGVHADLVDVFCKAGAAANGPENDGGPLWSAITFGYTAAAEQLARSGARVDNLVFAAAVGDLARVKAYFDDAGRLKAGRATSGERMGASGPLLDERHMLEYALIFAAGHGRLEIVEWLLSKGPDLHVTEPLWGSTALGQAKYHRRVALVARLEPLLAQ